jgi:hypothetical protein
MPCDPLFACDDNNALNERKFNVIFFIGTRDKFEDKTGYRPRKEGKGVVGCIDEGKKILYLLLNDYNLVDSAKYFVLTLVRKFVTCSHAEIKAIYYSEGIRRKIKGLAEALIPIEFDEDSDSSSSSSS